jgi:hypothetical protein
MGRTRDLRRDRCAQILCSGFRRAAKSARSRRFLQVRLNRIFAWLEPVVSGFQVMNSEGDEVVWRDGRDR